jgi:hypothetical protein
MQFSLLNTPFKCKNSLIHTFTCLLSTNTLLHDISSIFMYAATMWCYKWTVIFIWNQYMSTSQTHLYWGVHLVFSHTFRIDLGIILMAGDLACPFSWQISHKKFDVLSTSLPPIALQHSVKEETTCTQYLEQLPLLFHCKGHTSVFNINAKYAGKNGRFKFVKELCSWWDMRFWQQQVIRWFSSGMLHHVV